MEIVFAERRLQNIVILGDFNTYIDYNWPVQIFLDGKVTKDNPCWKAGGSIDLSGLQFKDAWLVTHQDESGFTFSNMVCIIDCIGVTVIVLTCTDKVC